MNAEQRQVRPLSSVKAGQRVRLDSIKAARSLVRRLAAMGLLEDVDLTVVSSRRGGPVVVLVRETKVMLGRGVVDKVLVY